MPAPERDAGRNQPGIETVADVRRRLAIEIDEITAHPDLDPLRKAHVLAQLARAVLHAVELATLEARVEALEAALKVRRHPPTKETKP